MSKTKGSKAIDDLHSVISKMENQLSMINVKLDSTVQSITEVSKKLDDVASSLEYTQSHFETVVNQVVPALVAHNAKIQTRTILKQMEIDIHRRKRNLMVFGLKGPKRENEHETLRVVTEFARNYLGVAPERWQIRMAHRLNINAENAGIIVVFNCGYMRDAWVQGSIDNAPALKQHKMSVVTDLPPVLRTVRSQLLDLRRQKLYTTKEWAEARVKQLAQWPFLQLVVQEAAPDGMTLCITIVAHGGEAGSQLHQCARHRGRGCPQLALRCHRAAGCSRTWRCPSRI